VSRILVFQHVECEGPSYLGRVLQRGGRGAQIVHVYRHEPVPEIIDNDTAGMIFLGGPMSANDDLSWIAAETALIRRAHARGLPLLGICLGAQLISKALGGTVQANPVKEIGWLDVRPTGDGMRWAPGLPAVIRAFHWHGETFSLPVGSQRLFESAACRNQGFALGNTLGLQFHLEVDAGDISRWATAYDPELANPSPTVQTRAQMIDALEQRLSHLHRVADLVFERWLQL
jgi:GMP synthase-like glutamine amidotransferase